MAMLTVRNLSDEVHRALRVRAAMHGRSTEAEVRAILENAVKPEGRVKLGSLLADIGRRVNLTDYESVALPTELHRHGRGRGVYRIFRRRTVRRTCQARCERRTRTTTSTLSTRVPAGRDGNAVTAIAPGSMSVRAPVSTS